MFYIRDLNIQRFGCLWDSETTVPMLLKEDHRNNLTSHLVHRSRGKSSHLTEQVDMKVKLKKCGFYSKQMIWGSSYRHRQGI